MPLPLTLSVAGDARLGRPQRQHRSRRQAKTATLPAQSLPSARSAALVAVLALVAAAAVTAYLLVQDLDLAESGKPGPNAIVTPRAKGATRTDEPRAEPAPASLPAPQASPAPITGR
jgi:hypothetical protein